MATNNSNATPAANAAFVVDSSYTINVTGFTYARDWAIIKGTCNGKSVSVIIGDKLSFGMQDMFMLKQSAGIKATYKGEKDSNGVMYSRFQLEEILF